MNWNPGRPYAAKAVIQHSISGTILNIWITFQYSMNQNVSPDDSKWTIYYAGEEVDLVSAEWVDAYTYLLTAEIEPEAEAEVKVKYDGAGPDVWDLSDPARETLETTWRKQWEPWGYILSQNIG